MSWRIDREFALEEVLEAPFVPRTAGLPTGDGRGLGAEGGGLGARVVVRGGFGCGEVGGSVRGRRLEELVGLLMLEVGGRWAG
jgi:hypothetical protein